MNTLPGGTTATNEAKLLAPFEEYMFWDDTPDYPMSLFLRVQLQGDFNLDDFRAACNAVALRQIRLVSTVSDSNGKLRWTPASNPVVELLCETFDRHPSGESERVDRLGDAQHLDLRRRPGLRIVATNLSDDRLEHDAKTRVLFQFHHSCCDGMGAVQYVHEVLSEYAHRQSLGTQPAGRPDKPAQSENDRARARHPKARHPKLNILERIPSLFFGLLRLSDFLRRKPSVLATCHDKAAMGSGIVTRELDNSASARYFQTAKQQGVTVNDLLVRDLFHAVRSHFSVAHHENVRLLLPINLRSASVDQEVKNNVGMIFVDRKHEPTESDRFLHGISREMQRVKRWQLGQTSLRTLRFARYLPGGIRTFLRSRDCWATAVLSNLGLPFGETSLPRDTSDHIVAGGVTVERIEFVPPIRENTRIALGVITYANRLQLTLHYDASYVTRDAATRVLQAIP